MTKNIRKEPAIATPIPSAAPLPIDAPVPMPAHRVAAFRTTVAHRLRDALARGEKETDAVQQVVAEQVAMAKVLVDHDFVHAAASIFISEMGKLGETVSMQLAHTEIESIFKNRVADAKGFVLLLAQPEFIAAVRAEAAQPAPAAKPYELSAAKKEEMIRRLVQAADKDGPEPAVHVAGYALGQRKTHEALASLFRPSGALRAPLVHALATAWPQARGDVYEHLAASWLKARHDPAHSTADAMKEGGDVFKEAIQRAVILQQQRHGELPTVVLSPAPPPSPVVSTPAVNNGTVITRELALDNL